MTECASKNAHRIIPALSIKGADKAIEQYKKAFGAIETHKMLCPQTGVIAHAGLKIGETEIFISEENPKMGCVAAQNLNFYLYVPKVDDSMKQALKSGLQEVKAAEDMFWGDRMGVVSDAFGIKWTLATHVRDVTEKEMTEAMKKMASKAA
jgi:PhnB protein